MKRLAFLFLLLAPFALPQASNYSARRIQSGTTLPTACTVGVFTDVFIKTNASAASQEYVCTTGGNPGVWTQQGGGTPVVLPGIVGQVPVYSTTTALAGGLNGAMGNIGTQNMPYQFGSVPTSATVNLVISQEITTAPTGGVQQNLSTALVYSKTTDSSSGLVLEGSQNSVFIADGAGSTGNGSNPSSGGSLLVGAFAYAEMDNTNVLKSYDTISASYVSAGSGGASSILNLVGIYNANFFNMGTITNNIGIWVDTPIAGFSLPLNNFSFYASQQGGSATNDYDFWADEQGVFRIRADNTFNSVYQAIPALYNPQFTKYTPGAVNYERLVLSQWSGNVAQIGTESGGTGTLRQVQEIGKGWILVTSTFSSLSSLINGTQLYCSDCTVTSAVNDTCVGSGSGAAAERINGVWACRQ
jgi:hypothetical protein